MDIKYSNAIKAGILGGILLSIVAVINAFFGLLASLLSDSLLILLSFAVGFIALVLAMLIFLGAGALSAKFTREWIKGMDHAILFGGIAGCTASLITIAISLAIALAAPFFIAGNYSEYPVETELCIGGIGSVFSGTWQCCCSPFVLVVGTFLGIFGSAIYTAVNIRK